MAISLLKREVYVGAHGNKRKARANHMKVGRGAVIRDHVTPVTLRGVASITVPPAAILGIQSCVSSHFGHHTQGCIPIRWRRRRRSADGGQGARP